MKNWIRPLRKLGACQDALDWCGDYDSSDEAWQACVRGDWMLWAMKSKSITGGSDSHRKLVLLACECARLALPLAGKGEDILLKAIETTEAWARGDNSITLEFLKDLAYFAFLVEGNRGNSVLYAVLAAVYPTHSAHYSAFAATYAALTIAYVQADTHVQLYTLKKCADIVRKYYPEAPEVK